MLGRKSRDYILYTVGPVEMFDRTLEVRNRPIPYFRNQAFSNEMFKLDKGLKELLHTSNETEIIYLTASGTDAMDATVINLFTTSSRLLIINGGSFGKRFMEIAAYYSIPFDSVNVPEDRDLLKEYFLPFENNKYDGVLVNIDETSIAKLYDINIIEDFAVRHDALLIVDAISSFLCDPYFMDEHHIDVTIFSSQKGLCISPGLAFVALSKKAQSRLLEHPASYYANFHDYMKNMERGQTPFTPAVGTIFEAIDMVDYIQELSLDKWLERIESNAKYFRSELVKRGYKLPNFRMSNAVTMFFTPNNSAHDLKEYLSSKGLFINPSSGKYADNAVRVAHIGDLNKEDYDLLLKEIDNFYNK